jgi:hypothetical protein
MKRLKEGSRESSLQQRSHEFYKEKWWIKVKI